MASWAELIEDKVFSEAADLAKLEASVVKSTLRPLFLEARQEMSQKLIEEWELLSLQDRGRVRSFIITLTDLLEQSALEPIERSVRPVLENLAAGTYAQSAMEINTVLQVQLLSTTAPPNFFAKVADRALIENQPLLTSARADGSPSWWMSLRKSERTRLAREIRKSLILGESTQQATQRFTSKSGVLGVSSRNAESVVRTSIHSVTNAARAEFYEDNQDVIDGVESIGTLDSRTTIVCRAYDGLKWSLPDYKPIGGHNKTHLPPPRHFRCRSVLIPVLSGLDAIDKKVREMGMELEPTIRAAADGPRERRSIKGDMNGWLRSQSENKQNQMLGIKRAELWRSRKIGLRELVDSQGEVLPIESLEAKALQRSLPN